ncbi:MAG: low molecular weight phosphotyrosine protein phosphatase [Alphaproteobacteria bacterium]|nr:low molecular weight phosphotyrosine protein phosphatase [Alphaproteobacteria bacterium]MBO6862927.1 low molecular weight phosphotyrosine protein phosphatase [Alphaproteobacteria bacterium]
MTKSRAARVLMVCTGNICRSPSAEGVLRHLAIAEGLADRIEIDSAGTTDWHAGEPPSQRAQVAAKARGYDISGLRARPLRREDYFDFDWMLAMDEGHIAHLVRNRPEDATAEIVLFLDPAPQVGRGDVPDPYYGGEDDYEYSLDLIEAGCRGWLERLKGGK